jgi:hypothetical protein
MMETAYYFRYEAGFEAVPAENYVDYMTNVMPVGERHLFCFPSRGIRFLCEVAIEVDGSKVLMWSLRKPDAASSSGVEIQVEEKKIDDVLKFLDESNLPRRCIACDEIFGDYLRFF